jgi:hypothetical protein
MAKEKYKDEIRYNAIAQYEAETKYAYQRTLKAMELALQKKVKSFVKK